MDDVHNSSIGSGIDDSGTSGTGFDHHGTSGLGMDYSSSTFGSGMGSGFDNSSALGSGSMHSDVPSASSHYESPFNLSLADPRNPHYWTPAGINSAHLHHASDPGTRWYQEDDRRSETGYGTSMGAGGGSRSDEHGRHHTAPDLGKNFYNGDYFFTHPQEIMQARSLLKEGFSGEDVDRLMMDRERRVEIFSTFFISVIALGVTTAFFSVFIDKWKLSKLFFHTSWSVAMITGVGFFFYNSLAPWLLKKKKVRSIRSSMKI